MTTITPSFPQTLQANLSLDGPAGKLELLTSYPEVPCNPPIVAVICHPHPLFGGNLNNKVIYTLARSFHALGLSTVRFNFRGVGQSQGHYDHGIGETDDLLAVLQWLKITCANPIIWLAGFSFGAYVAARAVKQAQTAPIEQLICVAPPIDNFPFTTLLPFPCPWVLIQGDQDEIVAPSTVFSWVASLANPPTLITIKNASHFFHGHLIELQDQLITVLSKK
jgi:uncharacterized protein